MDTLTDVWWRLFVNRIDGALRARGRGWVFDPAPLTKAEFGRALNGAQPLGVYATDGEGMARWVCLDADTEAGTHTLVSLANAMEPTTRLFEHSRRGAHLWRFCPPTPWREARDYGEHLLEGVGLKCEVFPKSAGRTGVRLPLSRHPKTGERYPLVDPQTGEIVSITALREVRPAPLPAVPLKKVMSAPAAPIGERGDFAALFSEVSRVTRLRQYGPERAIGRCPFHDDRRPSLGLLGGFWRCWAGCGEGGIEAFRARVRDRGMR